jgi:hypothetical protein
MAALTIVLQVITTVRSSFLVLLGNEGYVFLSTVRFAHTYSHMRIFVGRNLGNGASSKYPPIQFHMLMRALPFSWGCEGFELRAKGKWANLQFDLMIFLYMPLL